MGTVPETDSGSHGAKLRSSLEFSSNVEYQISPNKLEWYVDGAAGKLVDINAIYGQRKGGWASHDLR